VARTVVFIGSVVKWVLSCIYDYGLLLFRLFSFDIWIILKVSHKLCGFLSHSPDENVSWLWRLALKPYIICSGILFFIIILISGDCWTRFSVQTRRTIIQNAATCSACVSK
jgi:hypothetical protein